MSYCEFYCSSIKTRQSTSHIILLPVSMATIRRPAKKKRALEQLLPDVSSDMCLYWPASPAFDPQRVLLWRLFFFNSNRTKYVSVVFYPARDYQHRVKFGAIQRGELKYIILIDEHLDTLADCLPKLLFSICNGGTGAGCVSGDFRLSPPKNFRSG